ncbi:GNAT family N-acetyltransferase [Streptomyces sp. GC420]|nr:GNAT family N-acetyltransferase [Streptomyces sp. GC420]
MPSRTITLRTGHNTLTRLATVGDHDAVNDLHARCSTASRCTRYQSPRQCLSPAEWRYLTHIPNGLSWVTHAQDNPHTVIAVANLMLTGNHRTAELGLLVEDRWQSRGLGTALARHAVEAVPLLGCRAVTVTTGADNIRMLRILTRLGTTPPSPTGPVVDVTISPRGADRPCS